MKSKSSSQNKNRSRSLVRTPSTGLLTYLDKKYQKSIPVSAVTAAHKLYGKAKPLEKESKFIKRFSDDKGDIDAPKFVEYLNKNEPLQKGRPLKTESINRVYQNYANHDGKLSFEYIMKMGEKNGAPITEKMAKAMVRKYGKGKDHLSIEDCLKINDRWSSTHLGKSSSKKKK